MKRTLNLALTALTVALLAVPADAQGRRSSGRTPDAKLLERFDRDDNGWPDREERAAARVAAQIQNISGELKSSYQGSQVTYTATPDGANWAVTWKTT